MNPTDPTLILEHLDAEAIARELEELRRREHALRVLLRAARARERRQPRSNSQIPTTKGGN
jgi:hypothetical protein